MSSPSVLHLQPVVLAFLLECCWKSLLGAHTAVAGVQVGIRGDERTCLTVGSRNHVLQFKERTRDAAIANPTPAPGVVGPLLCRRLHLRLPGPRGHPGLCAPHTQTPLLWELPYRLFVPPGVGAAVVTNTGTSGPTPTASCRGLITDISTSGNEAMLPGFRRQGKKIHVLVAY